MGLRKTYALLESMVWNAYAGEPPLGRVSMPPAFVAGLALVRDTLKRPGVSSEKPLF